MVDEARLAAAAFEMGVGSLEELAGWREVHGPHHDKTTACANELIAFLQDRRRRGDAEMAAEVAREYGLPPPVARPIADALNPYL